MYAPVSVIVGVTGIVKPLAKAIVIVSPARSIPVPLEVKPTVQVEQSAVLLRRARERDGGRTCRGDPDVRGGSPTMSALVLTAGLVSR